MSINPDFDEQAQRFFRESIDAYEAFLQKPDSAIPSSEMMMTLRQLCACYLKLETGEKVENLTKAIKYCLKSLDIAQALQDEHMEADLKGQLGSCAFELGMETGDDNLIREAVSYHMESATAYAQWKSYWQQQAMNYGYAAYCVENLTDCDSASNVKRRVEFYEKMLGCLPLDAPKSYVNDINRRLLEAKKMLGS